jgi:hypothetical protein
LIHFIGLSCLFLSQDTLLAASNAATRAVGSVMGAMPNRVLDVPLVAALG